MTNQPKPINRSAAFWIGLAVHLILGVTLYYNTQGTSAGSPKTEMKNDAVVNAPAVP